MGIDLTPKMIEVAKKKNIKNAEFIVGDCENLPFNEDSFDVIVCSQNFYHYPNPQNFFKSVKKTFKSGGKLILRCKNLYEKRHPKHVQKIWLDTGKFQIQKTI